MRVWTLTVTLLLALPGAAIAGPTAPARVITITGEVTSGGKPVKTNATQLTAVSRGTPLLVTSGATAQLMLRGSLAVGIMGQADVIVGGWTADVEVRQLAGAVRMGGNGGSLTIKGWRVELASTGASVLLHGNRLHVLEGTALVRMPMVKAPPVVPRPAPAAATLPGQPEPGKPEASKIAAETVTPPPAPVLPTTTTLAAGKAMALGLKIVPATAGAPPPAAVLRATSSHGVPAPWTPGLGGVSIEDIRQARIWMQGEQQAQRETAACGCTEGGGAQGGALGGKGLETGNVQKTVTAIKIRVEGVPKKSK